MSSFHAIIPAGGAGKRLWPLSRAARPKFLLDLTGSGRTLIQQTWDRLSQFTEPDHIHVVAGPEHTEEIRRQLPELENLIIEPQAHDSMPAIGLATLAIQRADPGAIIGTFAADHVIDNTAGFTATIRQCIAVAESGTLCTIGIAPHDASTAYGYIQSGGPLALERAPDARHVANFAEKPDAATATAYLAAGTWAWNAGMFIGPATIILQHLDDYHPELHDGLKAYANGSGLWGDLPSIPIDRAIAEPAAHDGKLATVPASFGWDDLGDFAALAEYGAATQNDVLWLDAYGTVFATDDGAAGATDAARAVSVLGIADAVIVDTGDNLLITTRAYAQRVKELPGLWRDRDRPDLT